MCCCYMRRAHIDFKLFFMRELVVTFVVWRMPRILVLTVYLLVFLILLTLFSYCAHLVGSST